MFTPLLRLRTSLTPTVGQITLACFAAYIGTPLLFILTDALSDHQTGYFADFLFTGGASFIASWAGFALLALAFVHLTRQGINGLIPTTLAGGLLGPFAYMIFAFTFFGGFNFRSFLQTDYLILMCSLGAIHALVFWLYLSLINTFERLRHAVAR
ncbi:hypothetical protein [Amylibacter sp. IMCC11727]|uniref:hypothetical protein n=1 Tax=Amylibacter sp. IMCC11727 TaxID=3039851 RepID=UPI00244DC115|nr:hypothetical protein [Amylibacter sp. IMCC11727]WGI23002.1 hypothetical protein QBD29_06170 [Amylibacter sp. IMCC11727]